MPIPHRSISGLVIVTDARDDPLAGIITIMREVSGLRSPLAGVTKPSMFPIQRAVSDKGWRP